ANDVLDGTKQCGQKVLVIGGGLVGCETADYLGEHGFDVTIVEGREEIALDIISEHKIYLLENFKENHVQVHVNCMVESITKDGIKMNQQGQMKELTGFDSVVLALGSSSHTLDIDENIVKEIYVIGDALKARRAIDATREAREVVIKIEEGLK
ncbi:MAG: FAD-dependent oxidoreductase, partial [Coprobacillus sp.]